MTRSAIEGRGWLSAGLLLCALLAPVAWGPAAAMAEDSADKAYWQEQYLEVVREQREAREALAEAEHAYTNMQQRSYPRGEGRRAIQEQLAAARVRLEKAERALEEFPERARRAGALPGWFREVEP